MKGDTGLQTFVHFAYSTSANGVEDFSTIYFDNATYIGTYTSTEVSDSQNPAHYEWKRFVGERGEKGEDGSKGDTFYLHIAYSASADGSEDFNVEYFEDAKYIGTYTSITEQDSQNYLDYEWKKFKGEDGYDGVDGKDGTSVVIKGSVTTLNNLPSGANVGDLYIVNDEGNGYVWNGQS